MRILAIESSCDETCAAIVEDGRKIISNIVASQIETHKIYGGVVPEIASRQHTEAICFVTEQALSEAKMTLSDVDAIAVTAYPGLIGALLVGVNYAKGLALASGKPLIPVHHIRGHVAANYIAFPDLEPPFLCLIVSGGHTMIAEVKDYTEFSRLGSTHDDAAGECFDKVARVLGLSYPGGVNLDKLSHGGKVDAFTFPDPKVTGEPLSFSFSGLKTAAINTIHNAEQKGIEINKCDFAASFCRSVADILCSRLMEAARITGHKKIVLAGGVSANSQLREAVQSACEKHGYKLYMPPLYLCGDNGAMIGAQAFYEYKAGVTANMSLNAQAYKEII